MPTIADIDPESSEPETPVSDEPVFATINSDGAVFESLASETARQIVSILAESPTSASNLAVDTNTSIQNVQYHLDRLQSAGIVESVGMTYSTCGREMDLYGLSGSPIVLVIGDSADTTCEESTDHGCV